MYMMNEIVKPGFGELTMLLLDDKKRADIPKTMVFVDDINAGMQIANYFQSLLRGALRLQRGEIIQPYSSNLSTGTRETFMQDFEIGDIQFLVCTDAAGMGVNIQNVTRIIQWRLAEHLTLAFVLQRIRQAGQDSNLSAVSIVFVDTKYIILTNKRGNDFCHYTIAIHPRREDSERTADIISTIYKDNLQTRKTKKQGDYYKINPALLWFVNTVGCRRCLTLKFFLNNSFFRGNDRVFCCDNCMWDEYE